MMKHDGRRTLLPLLGVLLLFCPITRAAEPPIKGQAASGQAQPEAAPPVSYKEFLGYVSRQRRSNPTKAIAQTREYLASQPMPSDQVANLYAIMATIYSSELRNNVASVAVLDEGLQKLNGAPERYTLLVEKARVLVNLGRFAEAEKLVQDEWKGIAGQGLAPRILPTYVSLLVRSNKAPLALQITRQTAMENAESARDRPSLITSLVDQLLAAGQTDEALGWSKLNFMLCAYNDRAVQSAVQLVARVWTAKNPAANKTAELIAALQDSTKPNLLRDVKLPQLDQAALRQRAQETRSIDDRLSALILCEDWQAAVLAARRFMLERPQSNQGVLQVCRVFKAHDLDIKRANGFIEYYESGRGVNPIAEFLQQVEKPAPTQ